MAMTIRKDIEDLKDKLDGLISDDGETKMLFGKIVTIDADTGAVTLADPVEDDA